MWAGARQRPRPAGKGESTGARGGSGRVDGAGGRLALEPDFFLGAGFYYGRDGLVLKDGGGGGPEVRVEPGRPDVSGVLLRGIVPADGGRACRVVLPRSGLVPG